MKGRLPQWVQQLVTAFRCIVPVSLVSRVAPIMLTDRLLGDAVKLASGVRRTVTLLLEPICTSAVAANSILPARFRLIAKR